MTPSLWLATVLAAAASVLAIRAGRRFQSANPRLVAAVELLGLLYLGLLPPILLSCIAVGLGGGTSSSLGHGGLCFLVAGGGPRIAQLVLYAAAAGLVGRTGFFIARALLGAQRAELRGWALAGASRRAAGNGGCVWVVPSAKLAAYSAGWRHPKALVTTGLLDLLDEGEQHAVCHHEEAHVRLGHPRLLLVATALADTYRFFSPARAALAQLRRSFEAAADDETVKACGTRPLLCALAKVALAGAPAASLAFAEAEDLRYRIQRLESPQSATRTSSAALGTIAVVLTATMAWIACAAFQGAAPWPDILPCAAGLGWLGSRPARASWRTSQHLGVTYLVPADTTGTPFAPVRIGYLSRRLSTGDKQTSLHNAAVSTFLGRGRLRMAGMAPGNRSEPAPWRPGAANNLGADSGSMGLSS